MGTRINGEQLNNLIFELQKHEIPTPIILGLCKLKSLEELNVSQYNQLLFIIKN